MKSVVAVKDVLKENRTRLYRNLVANTITKNLSLLLADSTEENWMDAFYALELIRYQPPWVSAKVLQAFSVASQQSTDFQISLLELAKANYPLQLENEVQSLLNETLSDKAFAACAEYLLIANPLLQNDLVANAAIRMLQPHDTILMNRLRQRLYQNKNNITAVSLKQLLHHPFFAGAKIVFSLQRKNRDFPGLALVRDSAGHFVKDANGFIFSVPQLARSITNMPFYFRNGNTPQGIFRMFGIAVSRSNFIGPTPNIQLTMPFETSIAHFMNDSSIQDSVWTAAQYKKLLPPLWQNNEAIIETFYAGKIGRNEIIAHGTTVNPAYYVNQSYYPQTPTLGCLCTKEIWNEEDGSILLSDQQHLIAALQKAGGADGYLVVIELDDKRKAVDIEEAMQFLE